MKSKLTNTSFDTYVAHKGTENKEIGRANVVDVEAIAQPTRLIVVYNNDATINKVTMAEGNSEMIPSEFLDQFVGKTQDQPFKIGQDLKYSGKNKAAAQTVALALKRDFLVMQQIASNQLPTENRDNEKRNIFE
jgi:hypothetical protein